MKRSIQRYKYDFFFRFDIQKWIRQTSIKTPETIMLSKHNLFKLQENNDIHVHVLLKIKRKKK